MLKVQEFQELTGLQYLKAEIACKHDKAYEKKQWNERLEHFEELDLNCKKTMKNASNPVGLRAAVIALEAANRAEASGFMISLDASSSGLQLLALLVSCPISWKLCGGDENILDSYANIYATMDIGDSLSRKDVKEAIMTALYASTAMPKAIFGENINDFYDTMEIMAPGAWDLNLGA